MSASAALAKTNTVAAIDRIVRMARLLYSVSGVRGSGFGVMLQCKRPCSAARAKRAVRGGGGPVSGEFGDLGSPASSFVMVQGLRFRGVPAGVYRPCGFYSPRLHLFLSI